MQKGEIIRIDKKNVLNVGIEELGLVFVKGRGAIIEDIDGKEYDDRHPGLLTTRPIPR